MEYSSVKNLCAKALVKARGILQMAYSILYL